MFDSKKELDAGKRMTEKQHDRRTLALLGLELAGLIVAAVTIGLIAGSCGQKNESSGTASTQTTAPETAGGTAVAAASPAPMAPIRQESDEVASADSLPPEVTATVPDTLVTPGLAVEISAEASVDATELTLWDGLGKKQPFLYDEAGKVWRAYYRVPLKGTDRVGLSVTAKNEGGHWRRVWLFLTVDRPEQIKPVVEPGSAH